MIEIKVTGIEPVARAMSVFPNPAHGRVGVRFALGPPCSASGSE